MNGNRLGIVAMVLSLTVLGFVLLLRGHHSAQQETTAPTITATTTATTTTTPAPTPDAAILRARVRAFLENYYLVRANDTENIRRARLANLSFVAPNLLSRLSLVLEKDAKPDEQRRVKSLTVRGNVLVNQLNRIPTGGDQPTVVLAVPVIVIVSRDGKPVNQAPVSVTTEWTLSSGQWTITDFAERW